MGQGRVRPVFTALLPPGIVVVGRRRHRLRAPSSAAPGGSMAANPEHTAPAPCPRKKARSLSPARLALRGRRDSRNSGCWRPTAVARGGRGLLSPWGSCFATARGRYHLFPGGGRGVVGLGETLSGRGAATGHTLRTKPRPMACGPGRLHPPAAGCRPRPPASAVARRSLPA